MFEYGLQMYVLLIVLGAVFGSFLTAFIARLHDGRDWVKGRSECDFCHAELKPKSLVPVLSWVAQAGRCTGCRKSISWTYPATEIVVAAMFLLSFIFWPGTLEGFDIVRFLAWLIIVVGFVGISIYDLRYMLIPNRILYPLIALAVGVVAVEAVFYGGGAVLVRDTLYGLLSAGGVFYVLFQVSSGRWIGGGDVKLGFLLGILVGGFLKGLLVIMLASFLGLIVVLPVLLIGKLTPKSHIPFGPMLMLAASIVFLFGDQFLGWYIGDIVLL